MHLKILHLSSGLKMSGAVEKLLFTYLWNRYHQQIPGVKLIQEGAISIPLSQPCFTAGKISGVGNCHAAWRPQKTTVCTSIVYALIDREQEDVSSKKREAASTRKETEGDVIIFFFFSGRKIKSSRTWTRSTKTVIMKIYYTKENVPGRSDRRGPRRPRLVSLDVENPRPGFPPKFIRHGFQLAVDLRKEEKHKTKQILQLEI
jgi:hypothetical protein